MQDKRLKTQLVADMLTLVGRQPRWFFSGHQREGTVLESQDEKICEGGTEAHVICWDVQTVIPSLVVSHRPFILKSPDTPGLAETKRGEPSA